MFSNLIFSVSVNGLDHCIEFGIKSDDSVSPRKLLTKLIIQSDLPTRGDRTELKNGLTA
jgi:hypothetical protein